MSGKQLYIKLEIFILTFLSYVSIHALRTAYSYSKYQIMIAVDTDKSMLGLVDTCMLLSLGIGFLYHAFVPDKKPVKNLSLALFFSSVTFIAIPIAFNYHLKNVYTLLIFMTINGFAQSYVWATLLVIVNSKWDREKNSTALGFWATNVNVGNIIGLMMCQQVHIFNWPWEDEIIESSALVLLAAVLVFLRIKEIQKEPPSKSKSSNKQQLSLIKMIKQPAVFLVTATLSCVKAVIYGIMLWLPMYFHNIGLSEYSTYIPIAYDISSIIGSIALGYLFGKVNIKGFLLAPLMIIITICFYLLKSYQLAVTQYFILISIVGMFLGGSYNIIVGLSTIQLTKNLPKQQQLSSLALYSAVTMSLSNIFTAFTQLVIGYAAQKDQHTIFLIFMICSAFAFFGFISDAIREINQQKSIQGQKEEKEKIQ